MSSPLQEICCACLPTAALPLLARLRTEAGVQVARTDRYAWVRWHAGDDEVLRVVMPIHGAELFRLHDGCWHRFGQVLPAFDFPSELEYQPLAHVLFPAPVTPTPPPSTALSPIRLTLQRDDRPRRTTGTLCSLAALAAWSDTVPTDRLTSLQAIHHGDHALVLGNNVPLLPASERFWGRAVLIPLGYAPDPALPESALTQAAGLRDEEFLLWRLEQAEVIEQALLAPLTRAGLRLAMRKERP